MYVLVFNNSVILGPVRWNRSRFENALMEELDIDYMESSFPDAEPQGVIVYQSELHPGLIKVCPVIQGESLPYNDRIEILNGPFWTFNENHAISSFRPAILPLDSAKQLLKDKVSSIRWNKQNAGVTLSIRGKNVTFPSNKETCTALQNYLSTSISSVEWKITKDNWVSLNRIDLGNVLNSILVHINNLFEQEKNIAIEIDKAATHQDLLKINLD